jgi:ferredoxin/flavodoxin
LTKIYYFSGTGNSLWSAKRIRQIVGGELLNIGAEAQQIKNELIIEADAVVIVFPSYAYGLPLMVRRFVKTAVFKTPYLAALVTYGSSPGGTLGGLRRILKKKGIAKMFFGRIPAVENYLALFGPPKAEALLSRVLMQEKATEEAARCIIERQENRVSTFCPFSALISWLFSLGVKLFYRHYRLSGDCNGCGVCAKICPASAILMRDKRPLFTSRCEHCQGCVNICPLRAIRFWRVKWGSPGYCHPQIAMNELGVNH